jgi:hypothetical protein
VTGIYVPSFNSCSQRSLKGRSISLLLLKEYSTSVHVSLRSLHQRKLYVNCHSHVEARLSAVRYLHYLRGCETSDMSCVRNGLRLNYPSTTLCLERTNSSIMRKWLWTMIQFFVTITLFMPHKRNHLGYQQNSYPSFPSLFRLFIRHSTSNTQ